jgi:hypothetical protein
MITQEEFLKGAEYISQLVFEETKEKAKSVTRDQAYQRYRAYAYEYSRLLSIPQGEFFNYSAYNKELDDLQYLTRLHKRIMDYHNSLDKPIHS